MEERPAQQFEVSIARLEEIVKQLETGKVGLDESVELFREGKRLSEHCEILLKSAEETIARLSEADLPAG